LEAGLLGGHVGEVLLNEIRQEENTQETLFPFSLLSTNWGYHGEALSAEQILKPTSGICRRLNSALLASRIEINKSLRIIRA
jgi:hypothetical protein